MFGWWEILCKMWKGKKVEIKKNVFYYKLKINFLNKKRSIGRQRFAKKRTECKGNFFSIFFLLI